MHDDDLPATALWRRLAPVVGVDAVSVAELLPGGEARLVARHGRPPSAWRAALSLAKGAPPCPDHGNALQVRVLPAGAGLACPWSLAYLLCWDGRRWLAVLARGTAAAPFSCHDAAQLDALLPGLMQRLLQECERAEVRRLLARLLDAEARFAALTVRERQVCLEIVTGASTERVARRLGIGVNSVLTYRKRIYAKLGISSLAQLLLAVLAGMRKRCVT